MAIVNSVVYYLHEFIWEFDNSLGKGKIIDKKYGICPLCDGTTEEIIYEDLYRDISCGCGYYYEGYV